MAATYHEERHIQNLTTLILTFGTGNWLDTSNCDNLWVICVVVTSLCVATIVVGRSVLILHQSNHYKSVKLIETQFTLSPTGFMLIWKLNSMLKLTCSDEVDVGAVYLPWPLWVYPVSCILFKSDDHNDIPQMMLSSHGWWGCRRCLFLDWLKFKLSWEKLTCSEEDEDEDDDDSKDSTELWWVLWP